MLPVYCMNQNNGVAWLDTSEWIGPPADDKRSNTFFPLNSLQERGLIKARASSGSEE